MEGRVGNSNGACASARADERGAEGPRGGAAAATAQKSRSGAAMEASMTANDFLRQIVEIKKNKISKPAPPGWKTQKQLAKEWGFKETYVYDCLQLGIKKGMVKREKFSVITKGKKLFAWHYFFDEEKVNKGKNKR